MGNNFFPFQKLIKLTSIFFFAGVIAISHLAFSTATSAQDASKRFDFLVREDIFAGLAGDRARFDKAMKLCEETLAKNPKHAEAMVWHGGGVFTRAGWAFQAGDMRKGGELWRKGLDETTGLDAQACRELHDVIERLKLESKTVILTTHYIEEAERLCDRVAIVDHGRVIAAGTPRELISGSRGQSRIELRTARPVELAKLRSIPFVESVTESCGAYALRSPDAPRALIELVKWMEAERHELLDLHITRPTLEDTFIELTGKRIRE